MLLGMTQGDFTLIRTMIGNIVFLNLRDRLIRVVRVNMGMMAMMEKNYLQMGPQFHPVLTHLTGRTQGPRRKLWLTWLLSKRKPMQRLKLRVTMDLLESMLQTFIAQTKYI